MAGSPRVFSAPGEYEYNGVVVRGVMTPLPDGVPHERRNVAYTIELDDGISVCHLGDLSQPLTARQANELKPVDVVLIPVGGHCTLSLDHALQTIQDLDPKVVVPMHFGHGQQGLELDRRGALPAAHGRRRGAAAAPPGGVAGQPGHRPPRQRHVSHPRLGAAPLFTARFGAGGAA